MWGTFVHYVVQDGLVFEFEMKFLEAKVTEHFFFVLWCRLYDVVLTLESVDKILICDHSDKSSQWSTSFLWYARWF